MAAVLEPTDGDVCHNIDSIAASICGPLSPFRSPCGNAPPTDAYVLSRFVLSFWPFRFPLHTPPNPGDPTVPQFLPSFSAFIHGYG